MQKTHVLQKKKNRTVMQKIPVAKFIEKILGCQKKKSKLIIIQIELKTSKRFQYKKIFFYITINYRTKILLMFQVVFQQDRTYHKAF